ncbi:MAG TPA: chemotaxis protein CheW [Vicinamibacterales bacterium]|jgi:Chemotaxis signal transduction protein|nr:chemotaxis protein CheW [Vicinamibacterales bacterium]
MTEATGAAETFIVLNVAGTTYAVRSHEVQHMEMVENVTRVPNAAPFVDGVVFSRGQVVPAVNLRARFGFERVPYDVRTRLVVVSSGGRSVGLVVDEGREFLRLSDSAICPPQESLAGLSSRYVEGIASLNGRLILVLNLDNLLNFSEPLIAA